MRKAAMVLTAVVLLSACGGTTPGSTEDEGYKAGWTAIGNGVMKKCDGTILVYAIDAPVYTGKAISTVPDAPECANN